MIKLCAGLAFAALAACGVDETLTGYADSTAPFTLQSVDGTEVTYRATISLAEVGQITGTAPCNSYGAALTTPYPWFALGPVRSTRRACPDIGAETAYLAALTTMTQAEVLGGTLILRSDDGQTMVFQSSP